MGDRPSKPRPAAQLPGFYYDEEKKKYFKIAVGVSSSSAYTSQDVKRRKMEDEHTAIQTAARKLDQGRIKRQIPNDPFSGRLFSREQGRFRFEAPEIHARGLVPQEYLETAIANRSTNFDNYKNPLFVVDHRTDLGPSNVDLHIAYEMNYYCIQADVEKYSVRPASRPKSYNVFQLDGFFHPLLGTALPRLAFNGRGTIDIAQHDTSLSANYSQKLIAMTWLSGSNQSGISITPMNYYDRRNAILLGPGDAMASQVDVHSSTAPINPNSPFAFAFGTSCGVLVTDKQHLEQKWIYQQSRSSTLRSEPSHIDVFALEFLADDPWLLLSGERSGKLKINDLRASTSDAGSNSIITHPSAITHIKQLDQHRIIVAGLDNSLCQYDLRFQRLFNTNSSNTPPHNKTHQTSKITFPNRSATMPILSYPDFYSASSIQSGFDVDLETGVVAAAQTNFGHFPVVQLFSLHGGHVLPAPQFQKHIAHLSKNATVTPKCLVFARDVSHRMKSLYVTVGGRIQRYSWADTDGDNGK